MARPGPGGCELGVGDKSGGGEKPGGRTDSSGSGGRQAAVSILQALARGLPAGHPGKALPLRASRCTLPVHPIRARVQGPPRPVLRPPGSRPSPCTLPAHGFKALPVHPPRARVQNPPRALSPPTQLAALLMGALLGVAEQPGSASGRVGTPSSQTPGPRSRACAAIGHRLRLTM